MGVKNSAERRTAAALERQGDEAAAAGRPAEASYRKAQKVLLPVGMLWSDSAEYERRRAAFDRLQRKIWALHGPPSPPNGKCRGP